jgi:hypothetical protein
LYIGDQIILERPSEIEVDDRKPYVHNVTKAARNAYLNVTNFVFTAYYYFDYDHDSLTVTNCFACYFYKVHMQKRV